MIIWQLYYFFVLWNYWKIFCLTIKFSSDLCMHLSLEKPSLNLGWMDLHLKIVVDESIVVLVWSENGHNFLKDHCEVTCKGCLSSGIVILQGWKGWENLARYVLPQLYPIYLFFRYIISNISKFWHAGQNLTTDSIL